MPLAMHDAAQVVPRLWITSAEGARSLVADAKAPKPRTIVACSWKKSEYKLPDRDAMRKHGIKHVHIMQFDDDAFKSPENKRWSKRHFFRALCNARNAIEEHIEGRKGAVAVHCYAGMNRGPSSVVAYLMTRRRRPLTFQEALGYMRSANKRRGQQLLTNADFYRVLRNGEFVAWYKEHCAAA